MAIYLIRGDLVNMYVDAIVANANVNLRMVEGVSRAIFHKAGDLELQGALRKIGHCDVGHAVITESFGIDNAKAIIHAVAPNYINGKHREEKLLRSTYENVFKLLEKNNFKSAAFPILSSDFNYPLEECYDVEKSELKSYFSKHLDTDLYVVLFKQQLNIFDDEFKATLSKYLNARYDGKPLPNNLRENNIETLKLIEKYQKEKGLSDEEIIVEGNLDKDMLKKIRDDQTYIIPKSILLSIGIALKLPLEDINKLVSSMGYNFGKGSIFDLIVEFYIKNGTYDVLKINDCLFYYNLDLLSKKSV